MGLKNPQPTPLQTLWDYEKVLYLWLKEVDTATHRSHRHYGYYSMGLLKIQHSDTLNFVY